MLPEEDRHLPDRPGTLTLCAAFDLNDHCLALIPLGHDLNLDQLVGLESPVDGVKDRGRHTFLADLDLRLQIMSQSAQIFPLRSLEHRCLPHRSPPG